ARNSVHCIRINQLQAVWFSERITQQSLLVIILSMIANLKIGLIVRNEISFTNNATGCAFLHGFILLQFLGQILNKGK
ncbi:hypothetical protein CRN37_00070, partial [Vibrio vulnificus]